jgi:N4-gp56 family major capsid protein
MAATSYGTNHPLAVKAWAKKLFVEALKDTRYAQFKGSSSTESLVSLRNELGKDAGDKVTIGLRMQLTGRGVTGDATLEGQEEALTVYNDSVVIDQLRHAVRSGGKMSEQRIPFEVREEAMAGLRDWWSDRIDTALFNQLAGATTYQTQANGTQSTSVDNAFSGNQAAIAPTATTNLIICDQNGGNTTEASLSATFKLNLSDIDRVVGKAKVATPAIRPLTVNGDKKYVLFLHPYQTYQLRSNTNTGQWNDISKAMLTGGRINDNPLITGLLGTYNNTLLVEDARVPYVASTVTNVTNFRRAIFCGAQAAGIAFGSGKSDTNMSWVEELFDYHNQLGVSAGLIFGLKKFVFNSQDFGTIVMSSYAPAL